MCTSRDLCDIVGVEDGPKDWVNAGDAIRQLVHPGLPHDHAIGCNQLPHIVRAVPLGCCACRSLKPSASGWESCTCHCSAYVDTKHVAVGAYAVCKSPTCELSVRVLSVECCDHLSKRCEGGSPLRAGVPATVVYPSTSYLQRKPHAIMARPFWLGQY